MTGEYSESMSSNPYANPPGLDSSWGDARHSNAIANEFRSKKTQGYNPYRQLPRLNINLRKESEPIIGIEYIIERVSSNPSIEAHYYCKLCETDADFQSIVPHLAGTKHRFGYLKKHYVAKISDLLDNKGEMLLLKRSTFTQRLFEAAKQVEMSVGRHRCKVEVDLDRQFILDDDVREEKTDDEEDKIPLAPNNSTPYNLAAPQLTQPARWFSPQQFSNRPPRPTQLPPQPWNFSQAEQPAPQLPLWTHTNNPDSDSDDELRRLKSRPPIDDPAYQLWYEEFKKFSKKRKSEKKSKKHKRSRSPTSACEIDIEKYLKQIPNINLKEFKMLVAKCRIKDDIDSETAIEISRALAEAHVQYRIKNMPLEEKTPELAQSFNSVLGFLREMQSGKVPRITPLPSKQEVPISFNAITSINPTPAVYPQHYPPQITPVPPRLPPPPPVGTQMPPNPMPIVAPQVVPNNMMHPVQSQIQTPPVYFPPAPGPVRMFAPPN